jgi:uncharacterized protein
VPRKIRLAPVAAAELAEEIAAELDDIYAQLPTVECQGRCQSSCDSVKMTEPERARILERHGRTVPDGMFGERLCPALSPFGRCSVYADRPFICRLWGLTPQLRCPHGCRPAGGFMPDEMAYPLLDRLRALQRRVSARRA